MKNITKPIEHNINEFDKYYKEILSSDNKLVAEVVDYVGKMKGKQIRPIMVMLACGMYSVIDSKTYTAAAVIELTHVASLIHDDIVDEAYTRRHIWSVNALWRSRSAVLIGDYVFSKAIRTAAQNGIYNIVDDISRAIENMSVGELQQSDATLRLDIDEKEYFDVIRNKTAILMGSCLYNGASIGGASMEEAEELRRIGEDIGYIFQVVDDILDYAEKESTGKQACNDIKERKITLPLIYALNDGTPKERKDVLNVIRHINNITGGVETVYNYVIGKKGIERAMAKVEEIKKGIIEKLEKYPKNEYRDALIELTQYICERKH